MKKISTLLVAGSMAAFATPAMAQDASGNFDGFRVQGVAGYDALKAGSSVDDDAGLGVTAAAVATEATPEAGVPAWAAAV